MPNYDQYIRLTLRNMIRAFGLPRVLAIFRDELSSTVDLLNSRASLALHTDRDESASNGAHTSSPASPTPEENHPC